MPNPLDIIKSNEVDGNGFGIKKERDLIAIKASPKTKLLTVTLLHDMNMAIKGKKQYGDFLVIDFLDIKSYENILRLRNESEQTIEGLKVVVVFNSLILEGISRVFLPMIGRNDVIIVKDLKSVPAALEKLGYNPDSEPKKLEQ